MATIQQEVPKKPRSARRIVKDSRGPNWGRLVAEGRQARGAADAGRWRIGHLASLVAKQYGSGSLQQFADDIGESYATVRRYRWVHTRYEPTVRFRFQRLSFSHFQAVAGLPDGVDWLQRAESGCWSVDELVRESRGTAIGKSRHASASGRRAALREARAHLNRLAALGDHELSKATSWLEPMLDDLAEEIETLRDRIRSVNGVRLGRYRSSSGGNGRQNSTRNGNGHRARSRA